MNSQNLVRMWRDQDEALLNSIKGEVPVESFAVMYCILYLLMFLWSSVSVSLSVSSCIPIEQFNSMLMATCSMDLEKMREKGGGTEGRKMCEQRDVGRGIIFSLILEKDIYRMPLYIYMCNVKE